LTRPLRFCMVTTFYPPYHFGGDGVQVHQLSNALARRGHEVDVVHDADAFTASGGRGPVNGFVDHSLVHTHTLKSRAGVLSPILTHQTGRPVFKGDLCRLLQTHRHDVVHFHNVSLIGPTILGMGSGVKLYTLHEHWLICPMHVLWKFDREPCTERACVACTLHGRRPPQWWRYTGVLNASLKHVDRFLAPSEFTRQRHLEQLDLPISVLPLFVPPWPDDGAEETIGRGRPYFLFVGRLVKMKGLQTIIPVFRDYPEADLLIVGDGPFESELRTMAAGMANVRFLGAVQWHRLRAYYRNAIALIVPSVGYESFGVVLVEAFSAQTPVIARRLGAIIETVEESNGGILYRDNDELVRAMRGLQQSPELRRTLGGNGYAAYQAKWTEDVHIARYLDTVERELEARRRRDAAQTRAR